ncbi:MAG: MoaD/ThiS family protein [archaeon]|nr:MoaD/ThiS family protein [archaeon]
MVKVIYEGKKKDIALSDSSKISDMLKKLSINTETVIVKVNGSIEPEDIRFKKDDNVEIIKIISGG